MTNSDYEKLLNAASAKLGASPDKLRSTLEKGDIASLSSGLSAADKKKLRSVLADRALMEKLKKASSPEEIFRLLGQK